MKNILFDKRTRSKRKKFFQFGKPYYELEKIPFKEKVYTALYNMEKTGFTTKGEVDWEMRMRSVDSEKWEKLELQFKIDFSDYAMNI